MYCTNRTFVKVADIACGEGYGAAYLAIVARICAQIAVMQAGRREIIRKLCGWYGEATRDPAQKRLLPAAYQARLDKAGTESKEKTAKKVNEKRDKFVNIADAR